MGMIVHDLKTPLQSMLIGDNSPPITEPEHVKQAATMMLSLVMDILDVQKFADAKMQLSQVNLDIHLVAQDAIAIVRHMTKAKSLQINNRIEAGLLVWADRHLLNRVFVNLLNNAAKFSPHDGQITLENHPGENGFIQLSVEDQGCGIPEEKRDEIFEQFGQLNNATNASYRGTGLGLTFCKLVIEAHKGNIGVNSIEHVTTTFWFTLPLVRQSTDEQPVDRGNMNKHQDLNLLTQQEYQHLEPLIEQLRGCEIFRISQIHKLIDMIKADSPGGDQWLSELREAVDHGNESRFRALLERP